MAGIEKGMEKVARNMLVKAMSIPDISDLIGLSGETIKPLK